MTYKYYANFYIETDSPPVNESNWVEFTNFLVSGNTVLNQRVESENQGQAGVITLDNIDLSFFYSEHYNGTVDNPVYAFFHDATYSSDLDSYPRVVIKICASEFEITDGVQQPDTETQIFYGVVDFSSISYPVVMDDDGEYVTTINFTVAEKLSALTMLKSNAVQRTLGDYSTRIPDGTVCVGFFQGNWTAITETGDHPFKWAVFNDHTDGAYADLTALVCYNPTTESGYIGDYSNFASYGVPTVAQTETLIKIGEILRVPQPVPIVGVSTETDPVDIVNTDGVITSGCGAIFYTRYEILPVPTVRTSVNGTISALDDKYDDYLVISSWLGPAPISVDSTEKACTFVRLVPLFYTPTVSTYLYNGNGETNYPSYYMRLASVNEMQYYSRDYYESGNYIENAFGVDVNSRDYIVSYDAVKIIQSIIRSRWIGEELDVHLLSVLGSATTTVELPINYFSMLIDEYPLNQESLDGIIELVKGIPNCYLYTANDGTFTLENKNYIDAVTGTNIKTLPVESLQLMTKKHMWDKLVDSANVYVKSWIRTIDDSDFIDGAGVASIMENIKPRNPMTVNIVATLVDLEYYLGSNCIDVNGNLIYEALYPVATYANADIRNGLILNYYADQVAKEYLLFYGVRRFSYDAPISKLENSVTFPMLSWGMLNVFKFADASTEYFFAVSMTKNLSNNSMQIELVGREGANSAFNAIWKNNIVVGMSQDGYIGGSGGGSTTVVSSSGSTVGGGSVDSNALQTFLDTTYVAKKLRLEGSADILGGGVVQSIKRASEYNRFLLTNVYSSPDFGSLELGSGDGVYYDFITNVDKYKFTNPLGDLIVGAISTTVVAIDASTTGASTTIDFLKEVSVKGENINTKISTDKALELELMKMNFQYISWAQFAVYEDFDDELKRSDVDYSPHLATVEKGKIYNGGDVTPDREFSFMSKVYANINRIITGTSSSVGLNFLADTAKSWFVNECKNLTLVDSAAAEFLVISNTSDTITVDGTPTAGAYYLKTGLPTSAVAFCAFEDSSNGGYGYTKLEVSFDGGSTYQTFLDTANNINLLEGTMAIAYTGTSYVVKIKLKNDGSGNGAIVYKFLVCSDPSCWVAG
jgi:hypothetical protein